MECAAAMDVAAALAEGLGARVFITESGEYAPPEALRTGAKECLAMVASSGALGSRP